MNSSLLFPVCTLIITLLFAGMLLYQFATRHKLHQLFWSIALSMASIATLSYVLLGIVAPASATGQELFRLYYIFGGAVMPAWLGLGSLALILPRRTTYIVTGIIASGSICVALLISTAQIDMHALSHVTGTAGANILQPGLWLVFLIMLNTFGLLAVGGVAIASALSSYRKRTQTRLAYANIGIFSGTLLIGLAGSSARFLSIENSFWLVSSIGWLVLFASVLYMGRGRKAAAEVETASTVQEKIAV